LFDVERDPRRLGGFGSEVCVTNLNKPESAVNALLPAAETIAKRLIARHETIATAESSTGGLIAAALLAVPGASAYFLGGAVVYTELARATLLGIGDAE